MKEPCSAIQETLGWGGLLEAEQVAHVDNCNECSDLAAELAALDAILAGEPVLPAPGHLLPDVMAQVALRRRRETRWVRAQALLWAAAALIVGAVGLAVSNPLLTSIEQHGQSLAEESEVSLGAMQSAQELAFELGRFLDASLQAVVTTPSPPWIALLALLPVVLLVNWSVARHHGGAQAVSA